MELELLVPTGARAVEEHPLAPRLTDLAGRRVGFFGNAKPNAAELLHILAGELAHRFDGLEAVHEVKAMGPTVAAPTDVMGRLRGCEAVVLAIAD